LTAGDPADARALANQGGGESDDARLARAAAERDPAAWAAIYERHYTHVYRYVRSRVGAGMAEDVTSEVFASAVRSIGGYSGKRPMLAWLYGIAKHRVADHFRKARPRESLLERLFRPPAGEESGETAQIVEALGSRVQDPQSRAEMLDLEPALRRLTAEQREVLVLRYLVGLSTPEIAAAMNKRATSIYSLEARALARMRRYLE
jgi:RNA polymerase sigma-70 factor (ECF subfamily)